MVCMGPKFLEGPSNLMGPHIAVLFSFKMMVSKVLKVVQ